MNEKDVIIAAIDLIINYDSIYHKKDFFYINKKFEAIYEKGYLEIELYDNLIDPCTSFLTITNEEKLVFYARIYSEETSLCRKIENKIIKLPLIVPNIIRLFKVGIHYPGLWEKILKYEKHLYIGEKQIASKLTFWDLVDID